MCLCPKDEVLEFKDSQPKDESGVRCVETRKTINSQ